MRRTFNPGFIVFETGYPNPSSGGYITWDTGQDYQLNGRIYTYLYEDDPDAEDGEGWYWYIITEDDNPVYNWYGDNPPAGAEPYL